MCSGVFAAVTGIFYVLNKLSIIRSGCTVCRPNASGANINILPVFKQDSALAIRQTLFLSTLLQHAYSTLPGTTEEQVIFLDLTPRGDLDIKFVVKHQQLPSLITVCK